MNYAKLSAKVLFTILITIMIFFSGISAFADPDPIAAPDRETEVKKSKLGHGRYLEEAVLKLVQEGKLSREKADKILEYKQKKADEFNRLTKEQKIEIRKQGKKGSLLKELIQEKIITEEEAKAIRAKLREMKDERLNDGMQSLIDKGVLTSKDIENIRSYMVKVREERKANIEKLKSMNPEERKEYFRAHKKDRKDILTKMVEDKVITVEQAKEIRKAIPELNKARL